MAGGNRNAESDCPLVLIAWTIANSKPYRQTADLMAEAAESYTPELHAETFEHLKAFLASGGVVGNIGTFEAVDDPAGGGHKVRAAAHCWDIWGRSPTSTATPPRTSSSEEHRWQNGFAPARF